MPLPLGAECTRPLMHTTRLCKVGESVMLAVPQALLDILNLSVGAAVGLTVEDGRLIVEPTNRRRYTLDELLAQCDASAELAAEDRAWLDDGPAGEEQI